MLKYDEVEFQEITPFIILFLRSANLELIFFSIKMNFQNTVYSAEAYTLVSSFVHKDNISNLYTANQTNA
jgi:hypothetical protein